VCYVKDFVTGDSHGERVQRRMLYRAYGLGWGAFVTLVEDARKSNRGEVRNAYAAGPGRRHV
jgi:hypothetical protein